MSFKKSGSVKFHHCYRTNEVRRGLELKSLKADMTCSEFVQKLINDDSHFEGLQFGDIMLKVAPVNATGPAAGTLVNMGDRLLDAIKNKDLWVVTKQTVTIYIWENFGDLSKFEEEFWPEEVTVENVKLAIEKRIGPSNASKYVFRSTTVDAHLPFGAVVSDRQLPTELTNKRSKNNTKLWAVVLCTVSINMWENFGNTSVREVDLWPEKITLEYLKMLSQSEMGIKQSNMSLRVTAPDAQLPLGEELKGSGLLFEQLRDRKLWAVSNEIPIHYFNDLHEVKKITLHLWPEEITYDRLKEETKVHLRIGSTNSPFASNTDVSIRISEIAEKSFGETALTSDHDIFEVLKTKKLWAQTKHTISIYYRDGRDAKCKVDFHLWRNEINSVNIIKLVTENFEYSVDAFEIDAIDPTDGYRNRLTPKTDAFDLLNRNHKLHMDDNFKPFNVPMLPQPSHSSSTLNSASTEATVSDGITVYHYTRSSTLRLEVKSTGLQYIDLVRKIVDVSQIKGTYRKDVVVLATNSDSPPPEKHIFTISDFEKLDTKTLWIVNKIVLTIECNVNRGEFQFLKLKFWPFEFTYYHLITTIASHFDVNHSFSPIKLTAKSPHHGTMIEILEGHDLDGLFSQNYTFHASLSVNAKRYPHSRSHSSEKKFQCKHGFTIFDFFLSYRGDSDKDVVDSFFTTFNDSHHAGELIHPFLDDECLKEGDDGEYQFITALEQSRVVVLVISEDCLDRILNADILPDNMFLEWELALELYKQGKIQLLPLLIGRFRLVSLGTKTRKVNVPFDKFDQKFPEKFHCHDKSPGQHTINALMKEIFRLHGEHVNLSKTGETKTKLLNALSKATVSNHTDLSTEVLLHTEHETLVRSLKPLEKEMERERTRILQVHVPETRKWVVNKIFDFIERSDKRLLWVRGDAGVGKSVTAALVSLELEQRNILGGMFFAKHDLHRNSARYLIRTMCYQLCKWNADFGRLILDVIREFAPDQTLVHYRGRMEMIFRSLILDPLLKIASQNPNQERIVLLVDALDETGEPNNRQEILEVFSKQCQSLPSFVKVIVTSRSEKDIMDAFESLKIESFVFTKEEIRKDAEVICQKFLADHKLPISDMMRGVDILATKAGTSLVWLSMAFKVLDSMGVVTLKAIEELVNSKGDNDADHAMDALYWSTLDRIFGHSFNDQMRHVLSAIALVFEPLKYEDYAKLLNLPLNVTEDMIRNLGQVLHIDEDGIIRLFHKSVSDYLTDPNRCRDPRFAIWVADMHVQLTSNCLAVLKTELRYNIANLTLNTRHAEIKNFKQLVEENISPHVKYAANYFWRHYRESVNFSSNAMEIQYFVANKLLNWIEVLSLLKLSTLIPAASCIAQLYKPHRHSTDYTTELLSDIVRLYKKFNVIISASALQVYITAIPFSPKKTRIYKHYINQLPTTEIPIVKGSELQWPACLTTLEGHSGYLNAVAMSLDGKLVISGSKDATIKVWSTDTGEEVSTLTGHTNVVTVFAVSSDGKFFASGSEDRSIILWSMKNYEKLKRFVGHSDAIYALAISSDSKLVVSGSDDHTVRLWLIETSEVLRTFVGHSHWVNSVAFSPDDQCIISGSWDKTVRLWYIDEEQESRTLLDNLPREVRTVALTNDGEQFVFGCGNNIYTCSTKTTNLVNTFKGHTREIRSMAISSDGKYIVSGSCDDTVKIWDFETGEELKTLVGHTHWVNAVAISHDGKYVVSGSEDKSIKIWSVDTDDSKIIKGHQHDVTTIAISHDEKYVVSGSKDKTVRVWSMETGRELKTLVGHEHFVTAVAISKNGDIVSGSEDKTVRVWDLADNKEARVLFGHTRDVISVGFSADEKYILSNDFNRNKIVWELETGKRVQIDSDPREWTHSLPSLDFKFRLTTDGWIVVRDKYLCWLPNEYRTAVKSEMCKWKFACVGVNFIGIIDFSNFT
ncbi:hypothetical protein HK098_001190 [Nowakowskiella sp. JEL0407]|nr:hypothetical protein HK098_001190 [Nowakowskiella sp. JEL0407]